MKEQIKRSVTKVMCLSIASISMIGNAPCTYANGFTDTVKSGYHKVTKIIVENPGAALAFIGGTLVVGVTGTTVGIIRAKHFRKSNIALNDELKKLKNDSESGQTKNGKSNSEQAKNSDSNLKNELEQAKNNAFNLKSELEQAKHDLDKLKEQNSDLDNEVKRLQVNIHDIKKDKGYTLDTSKAASAIGEFGNAYDSYMGGMLGMKASLKNDNVKKAVCILKSDFNNNLASKEDIVKVINEKINRDCPLGEVPSNSIRRVENKEARWIANFILGNSNYDNEVRGLAEYKGQ